MYPVLAPAVERVAVPLVGAAGALVPVDTPEEAAVCKEASRELWLEFSLD